MLEGIDIAKLADRALARQLGLLAQSPSAPEDMTVETLVRLGRYPHQSMLQPWSGNDIRALEAAMAARSAFPCAPRPGGPRPAAARRA